MSGVRSIHEMRYYSSDIAYQFCLVTDENDLHGHRTLSVSEDSHFREVSSLQSLSGVTSEGHG